MFLKIKSFLERVDYHRDQLLKPFIIKCWPRFITPNHLTSLRIIIAIVIAWMLLVGFYEKSWLIPLLIVGALLDLFDGSVARVLNKVTRLGTIMDPIADRLLILPIALFSLIKYYLWLLYIILALELYNAILAISCKITRSEIKANIFGKIKMLLYCLAFIIIFIFYFPGKPSFPPMVLLYISIIFIIIDLIIKTGFVKSKNAKTI